MRKQWQRLCLSILCVKHAKVSFLACSVVPDKQAAAEAEMEAAAVQSAATQLKTLLSETQTQQVILTTPYDAWEGRLGSMKAPEDLVAVLRDLEQELNGLGDGLPRGEQLRPASIKHSACAHAHMRCINSTSKTELSCARYLCCTSTPKLRNAATSASVVMLRAASFCVIQLCSEHHHPRLLHPCDEGTIKSQLRSGNDVVWTAACRCQR